MRLIAVITAALLVPALALAGPSIVGSMQGWDPADPAYNTSLNANGVHVLTKNLAAGSYEYKATETDAWDGNDFPSNQPFTLAAAQDVTWYVNFGANVGVKEGDEYLFHSMNPPIVAGDMQSELGGSDWDPTDTVNTVMNDTDGDDVWEFSAVIVPAGDYQCKVVLNNSWEQNTAPTGNYTFSSDGVNPVTFTYDMSNNVTTISTEVVTMQDVMVTFNLCLTEGIDSFFDVCVTGSAPELTTWGDGVLMSQNCPEDSPKLYEVDVLFPAGSTPFVEYKYKKDDCQTWENGGNHSFTIDDSSPTQYLVLDGWEFNTPDCPECPTAVEKSSWGTIKALYQ